MFKTRVVRSGKCKIGKTELLDAAQARHLRGINDELLKAAYCHMTIDGVDDRGHDELL
jgi:hypothetical protein